MSPPVCCSARDKPLLFYRVLPSLACLSQIAALFAPCSTMPRLCPTSGLHLTLLSQVGQVEPDGRRRTPQEWHVSAPPAGP